MIKVITFLLSSWNIKVYKQHILTVVYYTYASQEKIMLQQLYMYTPTLYTPNIRLLH